MTEVAKAIEDISSDKVEYQLVEKTKHIRRYKIDKHIDLYYKLVTQDKAVLITFFDTRQDPGKLKI
jgi:hypothetical protein